MTIHPRKNDHGKTVEIYKPHQATPLASWVESWSIATVVPDGPVPASVNGVPIISAQEGLCSRENWEHLAQTMDFEEPPFEAEGLKPAAGAVVVEPDGRLWLVSPTNQFGQYTNTFPKGKANGLSLKATALKEVFEELGLVVELFEHLIDITRTTSRTRYYLARRKAGNPADMGWESQAAHLVPLELARGLLNQKVDHAIIDRLFDDVDRWAGWFAERLRQYDRLRAEDRKAEAPFVACMKAATTPNYLGDPSVVQGLLEPYFQAVLDEHVALHSGEGLREATQRTMDLNRNLARIFSGEDPEYQIIGTWNTAGSLGALAVQSLGLDPDYYADENLLCILSEGLAGIALRLREITRAFEADPNGEFERDLLPRVGEILHFTASVLMGTQSVLFPEKTLKDFVFRPATPPPPQPGLFDLFPPDTPSKDAEAPVAPFDINELRKAFGLPLVEPEGAPGPLEVPAKMGRPITLPGPIGELAKALGGVGKLGEEVGVTPRTIRRWAKGDIIPKLPRKMLALLFDKHGIDAGSLFTPSSEV